MKSIGVIVVSVILAGCNLHAGYHEQKPGLFSANNGYWVGKIKDDIYDVSFTGGVNDSQKYVDQMALLTAAQTTIDNGYAYFEVLFKQTSHRSYSINNDVARGGGVGVGYRMQHKEPIRRLQIRLRHNENEKTIEAASLLLSDSQ